MKENQIKQNLKNPEELERLYHQDSRAFEDDFSHLDPEYENDEFYRFWKARLDFGKRESTRRIPLAEISAMIIACVVAGFLIKLPAIFDIDLKSYMFYEKNAGLIAFMGLSLYLIWVSGISGWKYLLFAAACFIVPAVYVNLLPAESDYRSVILAYIYLPLMLWCIFGIIHTGFDFLNNDKRINFIRYNGDLAIITGLIFIAEVALAALTIGLFEAIGLSVQKFYSMTFLTVGAVSAPVIGAFILRNYPSVTNRLAPVIASIFSPLVLITLIVYLFTIVIYGRGPFTDRNFLLAFNLMLVGVTGVIVFSVSEISMSGRKRFSNAVIFALAIVTILINIVALSAIFYRLGEYGISSNRMAVLISNLLVFINLILITMDLFKVNFRNAEITKVEMTIAKYLPVYFIWTVIVVFTFPLIFRAG